MLEVNKFYAQYIQGPDYEMAAISHMEKWDNDIINDLDMIVYEDGISIGDGCAVIEQQKEIYYTEIDIDILQEIYAYLFSQQSHLMDLALKTKKSQHRQIKSGDYIYSSRGFNHILNIEDGRITLTEISTSFGELSLNEEFELDTNYEIKNLLECSIIVPQSTYEASKKVIIETRDKLLKDIKLLVKEVEFRER